MNIKVPRATFIWVILFSVCFYSTISLPIERKSDRRRDHGTSDPSGWKNIQFPQGRENYSREGETPEQLADLKSSHRRPAKEDSSSNPELPFSLEEFQVLFRKYLDLFPQLRGGKKEEDAYDNMDTDKREHDNPNNQSGNLNVYIKGNVNIKGDIRINTSGNGNGMRNQFEPTGKVPSEVNTESQYPDPDTVDIVGPEDPNSDVVIIPRNNYDGKILRQRPNVNLSKLKHQK